MSWGVVVLISGTIILVHAVILWAGFLGAWLLVVGPVYQAALELREEDFEQERIRATMSKVPQPAPVSPWLLLVPPLWWWRRHLRRDEFQRAVIAHISDEDYEAFSHFMNKARGWMYVGAGGFLIAAKETWELVEGNEWPAWLFGVLLLLGLVVTVANTVASVRSDVRERRQRATTRQGS